MTQIIAEPQRLIDSFSKSFGEDYRETFEYLFSQYISDAVIAVTAEDIAAQAIAWASSHNEFYHDPIDIDADGDRYVAIQNALIDNLDARFICDHIKKKWDANVTTSGQAINEALFERYEEYDLLNLVSAIAADYSEVNNG